MNLVPAILASMTFAAAAQAQAPFHAYDSYDYLIEEGNVHNLVVDFGTERLNIQVPHGYSATVDTQDQSALFKEDTGAISITMVITTNSPGAMPKDETLKDMALAINPNESFLQLSSCATGYKPAQFVDTIHAIDTFHLIRTRHAYVSCPDGLVEFIFSSKDDVFDKGRVVFNLFVSTFRLEKLVMPEGKPPR